MSIDLMLLGAAGQIGMSLTQQAEAMGMSYIALSHHELDVCNSEQIMTAFERYRPKIIINAAAYTAVDKAECEPESAYLINGYSIEYLAKCANLYGSVFIYISTDYVFDGEHKGLYSEADAPHPISVYGSSKLLGELKVAENCSRYIIFRTSWVFGEFGANFVKTILKLSTSNKKLMVVSDQIGSPTYAGDIASALLEICTKISDPDFSQWGTYHLSGSPYVSWYEFAQEIVDAAYRQGLISNIPEVIAIPSSQYVTAAKRPENSRLDCTKIKTVFNIPPCDWKAALADLSPYLPK
jgi:dTDP-4-dehydrorhamnose reductase